MAERPPMFNVPQTGRAFAQQQAAFDQNSAARLEAMLGAQSDNFSSVMSNLDKIGDMGGSVSADSILNAFAGSQQPQFDSDYARRADALRLALTESEIGKNSRSGRGGGGSSGNGMWEFLGDVFGAMNKSPDMTGDTTLAQEVDADGNPIGEPIHMDSDEFVRRNNRTADTTGGGWVEINPTVNDQNVTTMTKESGSPAVKSQPEVDVTPVVPKQVIQPGQQHTTPGGNTWKVNPDG